MPNPNVFTFSIQGKEQFADPLKVRRILLQQTMGKCWGLVKEIARVRAEIDDSRSKGDVLRAELEAAPTTPEEMLVIQEIQKARAEGKQSTLSFDELPRVFKMEGFDNKVAVYSNKVAELEGILAEAAMQAFDLPQLNLDTGEGVTELEAIEIFKQYLEYAEGKGERLGS